MRLGFENRRQVYLLGGLCVAIFALAVWEFVGAAASPSGASRTAVHSTIATRGSAVFSEDPSGSDFEPHLRIGSLARSEQLDYPSKGRNIFAFVAQPPHIEAPAAPARPLATGAAAVRAPVRSAPAANDLTYLGYMKDSNDRFRAVLMHGGASLVARTGEIVFHRFKVGTIEPNSVRITDLVDASTQSVGRWEK